MHHLHIILPTQYGFIKKEQKIATNSNFLISEPSKFDIDFHQFVRLDCQV